MSGAASRDSGLARFGPGICYSDAAGDGPAGRPIPAAIAAPIGRIDRGDEIMATAHQTETRQFPTHIDIAAERRAPLVELLNQSLADTLDLMTQAKQAHWNVKGKDF